MRGCGPRNATEFQVAVEAPWCGAVCSGRRIRIVANILRPIPAAGADLFCLLEIPENDDVACASAADDCQLLVVG